MTTRYYVNVRDDSGNNPAFDEVSKDDFETLQGHNGGGAAIFLPGGYFAIFSGAGLYTDDATDETHRYLQFRAVRLYAMVAPAEPGALTTINEMSDPK